MFVFPLKRTSVGAMKNEVELRSIGIRILYKGKKLGKFQNEAVLVGLGISQHRSNSRNRIWESLEKREEVIFAIGNLPAYAQMNYLFLSQINALAYRKIDRFECSVWNLGINICTWSLVSDLNGGNLDTISLVIKQNFSKTKNIFIKILEVEQCKLIDSRIESKYFYFIIKKKNMIFWTYTNITNSVPLYPFIFQHLYFSDLGFFCFPYRNLGWIWDTSLFMMVTS